MPDVRVEVGKVCENCMFYHRLYLEVNLGVCANGRNQKISKIKQRPYLLAVHGHDTCKLHTPAEVASITGGSDS